MKPNQIKAAKVFLVISIPVFYYFFYAGSLCSGKNWMVQLPNALLTAMDKICVSPVPPTISGSAFMTGILGLFILWLIYCCAFLIPRPEREGEEHGTSR